MLLMISFQRFSSHWVSRRVRETTELYFTGLVDFSHSRVSEVYFRVQCASVFVYQLLLTLFSYSLGPVTPRMTYCSFSWEKLLRCAQKRDIAISTSRPYSER